MERREDVLEDYVSLDSILFITYMYPIRSRLQDLLDDPHIKIVDRNRLCQIS